MLAVKEQMYITILLSNTAGGCTVFNCEFQTLGSPKLLPRYWHILWKCVTIHTSC